MHILLLGATGPSGIAFLTHALRAHHELTIFARNPSKLPSTTTSSNPAVHIVQGEFSDEHRLREALDYGATVLVSFAGPSLPNRGGATPVADFYRTTLFPLIREQGRITRAMITSTASYAAPQDRFSVKWWLGSTLIKWVGGSAWYEINGMSRAAVEVLGDGQGVAWTLFRAPLLTNGEMAPVQAGFAGSGKDQLALCRSGMCIWVLNEIEERKWVGQAPCISNIGWI